jgi:transposase-like protein
MQNMATLSAGRPTEYDPSILESVAELAESGATDQQLADYIGVDRSTLYRWKHRYPAFRDALKTSKDVCDTRIERTLYEKADSGDVTSMIFWLKNRRPQEWRESRESGSALSLTVSGPLAERLAERLAPMLSSSTTTEAIPTTIDLPSPARVAPKEE